MPPVAGTAFLHHPSLMRWTHASLTDRGSRRRRNEDALLVAPERGLFAVADGMGGHAAGDVASRLAVAALASALPVPLPPSLDARSLGAHLRTAVLAAHEAILAEGEAVAAQRGMGTTLTVFAPLPDRPAAVIAHIGDSRVYRLRGGVLEQLTRDHTWIQNQLDEGMLTPAQARSHPWSSVLLRVLGGGGDAEPDLFTVDTRPGDLLLLCTDGLSSVVDGTDLGVLLTQPLPLESLAAQLLEAALLRGAPDNVSVILLHAEAPPL